MSPAASLVRMIEQQNTQLLSQKHINCSLTMFCYQRTLLLFKKISYRSAFREVHCSHCQIFHLSLTIVSPASVISNPRGKNGLLHQLMISKFSFGETKENERPSAIKQKYRKKFESHEDTNNVTVDSFRSFFIASGGNAKNAEGFLSCLEIPIVLFAVSCVALGK